jgi:1,4-alpha-glucan branching enzyme
MEKGYLALVLHAHLPYIHHPEYVDFLEEDWFFEAVSETYIPLINVFDRLIEDGIDFRITFSLSPPLMSMFADQLLQERCLKHIERLIELSCKEVERTRWMPHFQRLALMYQQHFVNARYVFADKYGRNLNRAFKKFQEAGKLEVITSGATHGYLPLMEIYRPAVRAQIWTAVECYKYHFGSYPAGIWLPECAYQPGDETILKDFGLRYLFTDTHGILHASPRPKYGVFAPIYTKSGVAAFGRDVESSKAVWSAIEGYPGDFYYRDFYRDIGFDLEYEYIKPYIHSDGIRINTGIKYYRITGLTNHKEIYEPERARDKATEHAGNFMFNREKQIEYLYSILDRRPIIISPYDAELLGHWWFEGPDWLNFLIRKIYYDQKIVKLITPSDYLNIYPRNQVSTPSMSSWGYKGYHEVWLEGSNDWIYRHLHKAVERMIELANYFSYADGLALRALNQAARELQLAQSSDWAFIMKTGTMVPYAVKRTKDHLNNFNKLYFDLKTGTIDEGFLADLENRNNIFPFMDYRVFRT